MGYIRIPATHTTIRVTQLTKVLGLLFCFDLCCSPQFAAHGEATLSKIIRHHRSLPHKKIQDPICDSPSFSTAFQDTQKFNHYPRLDRPAECPNGHGNGTLSPASMRRDAAKNAGTWSQFMGAAVNTSVHATRHIRSTKTTALCCDVNDDISLSLSRLVFICVGCQLCGTAGLTLLWSPARPMHVLFQATRRFGSMGHVQEKSCMAMVASAAQA